MQDYRAEFRPDVQALRALAVLAVVLYHANIPGVHGGFLGVDLFFVVSGFVITNVLLREKASRGSIAISAFYSRRIRRILPAATVVLIATVFATYHWLSFITGAVAADDAKYVATFVGNLFSMADSLPATHSAAKIILTRNALGGCPSFNHRIVAGVVHY